MKIPLARMAGLKRRFVMRPIRTTKAQAGDLAKLYVSVVRIWQSAATDRILPAYGTSVDGMTRDDLSDVDATVTRADQEVLTAILQFQALFRAWAAQVDYWHLHQFVAQMKYATNIDLGSFLGSQDATVEYFLVRNTALVKNVSDQIRGKIADSVFRGLQARTEIRTVAKEISEATGLGRARSLRIASDQTVKLSAALDQERQQQVGMNSFEWLHSHKTHPRPVHVARDHQEFDWDSEVGRNDPPGRLPFCGCKARGILEADDGSD